ncbi:YTH domain containing protein [Parasponia andersonii]|uniref:YTH domain-containing family protein n=1 Tax=Parasponia andersonii TaxID=3476 RepID=A0A2P5A6X0_PARAD|nr:YTH domain containing protein [Parasponia andersonii]
MATVAPTDQTADLLQKLSLDSQPKALDIPEPTKKPSANQFGSVDSGNAANGQIPSSERSVTPFLQDCMDPSVCYFPNGYPSTAYFHGYGYDGTGNEWDEYSRYLNPDGVEMTSGVYGDNGSLLYHPGYGYAPYGPYSPAASPVPTMGNDGQLYGPQHYQYPPYFQPLTPTSAPYTLSPAVSQSDVSTSVAPDQKPLPVETANVNSNGIVNSGSVKGNNGSAPIKPAYQNSSFNSNGSYARGPLPGRVSTPGYQDPRFGFDGLRSGIPCLDAPLFSDWQPRPVTSTTITSSISSGNNIPSSRNQNYHPNSQFMGLHHPRPLSAMSHGFINRMYPNKLYGQYSSAIRSGMGFGYGYDSRTNGRAWLSVDGKYKPRGRNGGYYGYGNENMDGLNELNRGPRAKGSKNQKDFAPTALAVKGQNLPTSVTNDKEDKTIVIPVREQYNKPDFTEEYADAKFFIIKSYSEDDVHKSIKYNVWASTPNGNKKLHAAYQEAQEKSGGCPVFLFFSVNTSGQFVGLAEMVGPVDFNKNVEYWQQDKWNGCFPVKWHIVKDVPNSLLKHITLDNNENKPVTNSRDTQEVKLEPGLRLIKIFKEHSSKTCILDDFGFYETRQKTIQEKKAKQQQFQKQVWEGKPIDKEVANGELNQKSLEVASDLTKDPSPTAHPGDNLKVSENGSAATTGDAPKGAKPVVAEKKIVANGC